MSQIVGTFGSGLEPSAASRSADGLGVTRRQGGLRSGSLMDGCCSGNGYPHDTQCVIYTGPAGRYAAGRSVFSSNEDALTTVDATVKSAPSLLSRTGYAGSAYTHHGWLTADQGYFLLNDDLGDRPQASTCTTVTATMHVRRLRGVSLAEAEPRSVSPSSIVDAFSASRARARGGVGQSRGGGCCSRRRAGWGS